MSEYKYVGLCVCNLLQVSFSLNRMSDSIYGRYAPVEGANRVKGQGIFKQFGSESNISIKRESKIFFSNSLLNFE